MRKKQLLFSFLGFCFVITASILLFIYGRGWRLNTETREFQKTGLLSANSWPSGASVYLNGGASPATATDTTLPLPSGTYSVRIEKEGFLSWEKSVIITDGLVYETNARLFPSAPELKPLTLTGVRNPILSPDGEKVAYAIASSSGQRNGIWVLDMKTNPLSFGGNQRQVVRDTPQFSFSSGTFSWTPDSKSVLVSLKNVTFLLDQSVATVDTDRLFDVTATLPTLRSQWDEQAKTQRITDISRLPSDIAPLASSSAMFKVSLDETKLLYKESTASDHFTVYNLKDKKTYTLPNAKQVYWLAEPENRHVVLVNDNEIAVIEFEGTNRATIFSGSFENGVAFPWPDGLRIVVQTSFNRLNNQDGNLYTISLR